MAATKLSGTLLLDYDTVKAVPSFFALLSLMLRAAGMTVVVFGRAGEDKKAAQAGIGYNDFKTIPAFAAESRLAKFNWAMHYVKSGAPVLWPDLDFGTWGKDLPKVDGIDGLIILNMAAVSMQGVKGQGAGQA